MTSVSLIRFLFRVVFWNYLGCFFEYYFSTQFNDCERCCHVEILFQSEVYLQKLSFFQCLRNLPSGSVVEIYFFIEVCERTI